MNTENLISVTAICTHHNIEVAFIDSLANHGLVHTVVVEGNGFIDEEQLTIVERFIRLHYELHINMEGIDAIGNLLEKLETITQDLNKTKARLRFYEHH